MVKKEIKKVVKNYLNALKEEGLPVRFGVIFKNVRGTVSLTHCLNVRGTVPLTYT